MVTQMRNASSVRRSALAISIFATTIVSGELAFVKPVAAVQGCAPAAEVHGDRPTVDAIVAELEGHGITSLPSGQCPAVQARIQNRSGGIVVAIVDPEGRVSERLANNVAAAATLIESWARSDVVAPLLTSRSGPRASASAPGTNIPSPRALVPLTVTFRSPGVRASSSLSLTADGEISLATDGSLWFGVSVGLCLRIGPVCAGALTRFSADSGYSGDSEDRLTGRLATDVLLGAGLPLRWGRWTMSPAIAVGVGWMRTNALSSSVGGDADVDSGGLRASAMIRMSLEVLPMVALDLAIGADVAPLAHAAPYDVQVAVLAGEPRGYLRCGFGVRIGGP